MVEKRRRQAALLRFVTEQSIATQDEMVNRLHQAGFRSTQSSISRDVRELGLVRVNGRYMAAIEAGAEVGADGRAVYRNELIISSEPIGANMIVIKTPPGSANAVAIDLDKRELPGIAGTVAGDDTLFVAVRSRAAQGQVLALLPNVIGRPHTWRDGEEFHGETASSNGDGGASSNGDGNGVSS